MIKTLVFKIKPESYNWLNKAAVEVNDVWNWARWTCIDAADRNRRADTKWLSGFELNNLSAGSSQYYEHINSHIIQRVNCEYAQKRKQFNKFKLKMRKSWGRKKSRG